ncbi:MAG: enoyl-CoA hydratase/isomerase family protein [Alphaproteobacteria bacterium]|nr:enoyl-CoA hydratase/isomerase family protein [Alphaproteobacteria bacterium]MBU1517152.1 enoyl-CoA hydratase/isomerase family protein [Alphaproteobacteria bacterium]MBU2096515.1 enoyl-CoA hydratase/isomerase family protein [Alphaproteobacteria bacterium]MBU2151667.1 enoyl-CoA hydratase/isomerase family protein [Alphaproteobacteria bacterium]MBU2305455.1 enoyl-CoA hydratase/isomerase family protein [Alphaproteobacteria bacterium]
MSADLLQVDVSGGVATVSLNRPDALNALSNGLLQALVDTFAALDDDAGVRCAVLRGNGRAFCVGADIKERGTMSLDDVRARRRLAPLAFGAMRRFSRPVVAQVHGYAIGSGLELALGCDFIFAAGDTAMGLPETAKASIPAGGGTQILPRLIGAARAKELIFTSRRFTAEAAERWGMVNRVTPADALDAAVRELTDELVAVSPTALATAKRAIDLGLTTDLESGLHVEAALYERVLTSEDRKEAVAAAAEKRSPRYVGR